MGLEFWNQGLTVSQSLEFSILYSPFLQKFKNWRLTIDPVILVPGCYPKTSTQLKSELLTSSMKS